LARPALVFAGRTVRTHQGRGHSLAGPRRRCPPSGMLPVARAGRCTTPLPSGAGPPCAGFNGPNGRGTRPSGRWQVACVCRRVTRPASRVGAPGRGGSGQAVGRHGHVLPLGAGGLGGTCPCTSPMPTGDTAMAERTAQRSLRVPPGGPSAPVLSDGVLLRPRPCSWRCRAACGWCAARTPTAS
jgi:hypothetical protein